MELIEELLHPLSKQRVIKKTQKLQYAVDEKVNLKKLGTLLFRSTLNDMGNRKFSFVTRLLNRSEFMEILIYAKRHN